MTKYTVIGPDRNYTVLAGDAYVNESGDLIFQGFLNGALRITHIFAKHRWFQLIRNGEAE